ncbi:MAG: hypothetical protein U9R19_07865, partial [Bacteroidota bacterium]|nr:hypothetical protein [Bacteroidota bacterium]
MNITTHKSLIKCWIDNLGRIVNNSKHGLTKGFNRIVMPCKKYKKGSYRVIITYEHEKLIKKLI